MSFHELQAQKSDARRRLISARVNRLCTKAERVWSLVTVALAFFVFFIFFIMNIHTELHISPRFIMSGNAVSFFPPDVSFYGELLGPRQFFPDAVKMRSTFHSEAIFICERWTPAAAFWQQLGRTWVSLLPVILSFAAQLCRYE